MLITVVTIEYKERKKGKFLNKARIQIIDMSGTNKRRPVNNKGQLKITEDWWKFLYTFN